MGRDLDKLCELEGLITNDLGEKLYELASNVPEGQAIVEIGSYHGKSTSYLAAGSSDGNKNKVFAVDPWSEASSEWRSSVLGRLPSPEFDKWDAQLRSVRLRSKVTPVQATSVEASKTYKGPEIGFLYIDADHHEDAAAIDLLVWSKHLAPDAVVAWDDYGTRGNPGVERAVKRLNAQGKVKDLQMFERLAITRYAGRRVTLSASIMAHPVRTAEAEELQASLDRPVDITYDTQPVPSPDPKQRWRNGKRAWEAYDPSADWHMVIQDDALVCEDLIAGLEVALAELDGKGIVSAYTGTGRPDQKNVRVAIDGANRHKHHWLSTYSLNWGVAFIVPTNTIDEMLAWSSERVRDRLNYDMRIGQYYRDILGWRTWHTHPSLVNHRDMASLVGHGQGGHRTAHVHATGSALNVDWSRHADMELDVPESARRKHKG